MLTLSETALAEIEARAAVATPGPWTLEVGSTPLGETGDYLAYCVVMAGPRQAVTHLDDPDDQQADRDGAFIAKAREDVPLLVLEVRRLQEELRRKSADRSGDQGA